MVHTCHDDHESVNDLRRDSAMSLFASARREKASRIAQNMLSIIPT